MYTDRGPRRCARWPCPASAPATGAASPPDSHRRLGRASRARPTRTGSPPSPASLSPGVLDSAACLLLSLVRAALRVHFKMTSPPRGTRRIGGSNLFKTGFSSASSASSVSSVVESLILQRALKGYATPAAVAQPFPPPLA